jgi:nitronate monooxygenase
VQAKHNAIRESLGIPEKAAPPDPPVDLSAKIDLLLDERISVLSFGLGDPGQELVGRCRSLGIKTIAMVSTVADAKAVEQAGIDAVIAQGSEAGGHRSHFQKPESPQKGAVGTMTLVPAVCDVVSVPVVAAGGIADGRGIAAALALGAAGVMLGTRFVATQESMAVTAYKEAVLRAGANDSRISDAASGRYARLIENDLLDRLEQAPKLPFMWQSSAVSDILDEARRRNDGGMLALWAGQSSSLINDLPSAVEVVSRLMDQTRQVIDSLK